MLTGQFQLIVFVYFTLQDILSISTQASSEYDCDFDNSNFCGWNSTGWQIENYISASVSTGPSKKYDGEYIQMDASRVSEATLQSGDIVTRDWPCFIFRYHMKGEATIGNLSIRTGDVYHSLSGHQGDSWKCGRIYLPDYGTDLKLKLVGYKKTGESVAIIALDALHFLMTTPDRCILNLSLTTEANFVVKTTMLEEDKGELTTSCDNVHQEQTCEKITMETTPIGQQTNSPTVAVSSTTTASAVTTENTWPDWQTYAIAIPSGVLLLSIIAVVVGVCARRKQDDKTYHSSLPYLDQPRMYARPSEAPSERYPNVLGNFHHEVYDSIDDRDVYDFIEEEGAVNEAADDYEQPVGSAPKDKDEGYTVLPAITKPQAPFDRNSDYLHPQQMNFPDLPGKKISISEQGEVCYTDVRESVQRQNGALSFSGTGDYLDVR